MSDDFKGDFDWQMSHLAKVMDITNNLPVGLFTAQRIAPREHDIKRATDLMIVPFGGKDIAVRLRGRHRNYLHSYGTQFTIRERRDSGAETELSKIRRGLADWFFYGHIERGWRSDK